MLYELEQVKNVEKVGQTLKISIQGMDAAGVKSIRVRSTLKLPATSEHTPATIFFLINERDKFTNVHVSS